jgi:tetratricopeptide (TPR) repeat protein
MEKDRVKEYLLPITEDYIFDELSDDYLRRAELTDILKGVPVPLGKSQLSSLTNLKIAHNMAVIIGCDPDFPYVDNYKKAILKSFGQKFIRLLIKEGLEKAERKEFLEGAVLFRAARILDPKSVDALYAYAKICKDIYDAGEDNEYIGRFKAESIEAFEALTKLSPDFDMPYYFLGYGYLNLGLYLKAKLAWDRFLNLASDDTSTEKKDLYKEIQDWQEKLKEPILIEEAYNDILAERFPEGIRKLSPYTGDERFCFWWPLWYYLGLAKSRMGMYEEAEGDLLRGLSLSPSNTDIMEELVLIYHISGDQDKEDKYRSKIDLIIKNGSKEKNDSL